jgi:hypothetical protein
MKINEKAAQQYKRRKLSESEKDQIRARILQHDDREKIAKDFKCSLKQIDGFSAWIYHSDSWS